MLSERSLAESTRSACAFFFNSPSTLYCDGCFFSASKYLFCLVFLAWHLQQFLAARFVAKFD